MQFKRFEQHFGKSNNVIILNMVAAAKSEASGLGAVTNILCKLLQIVPNYQNLIIYLFCQISHNIIIAHVCI